MEDCVHEALMELLIGTGMTRNEALAYLTLLEDDGGQGLTGYEVAARSKVPRSAVYGVLRKLEEGGAAFSHGADPARYVAIEPSRLVQGLRRGAVARLDALEVELQRLPSRARPEPVWILSSYDEVLGRIEALIRTARESLVLSLWPRELQRLLPALREVSSKVHRVLFSPGPLALDLPGYHVWTGALSGDAVVGWDHKAVVVVDGREALMGGAEVNADNQAVLTTNSSLVGIALDHVVLDITLLAGRLGKDPAVAVGPLLRTRLPGLPERHQG